MVAIVSTVAYLGLAGEMLRLERGAAAAAAHSN